MKKKTRAGRPTADRPKQGRPPKIAVTEIAPPEAPPVAPAPTIASVARAIRAELGGSLPKGLASRLTALGLEHLPDLQRPGALAALGELPASERRAVSLLQAHADLAHISPDLAANTGLIERGYTSPQAIADTAPVSFVEATHAVLGDAGAAQLHAAAQAHVAVLDNVLAGIMADPGAATGAAGAPLAMVAASIRQQCQCENCKAAMSPAAYLADLIGYVVTHVRAKSATIDLAYLEKTFLQPFGDLAVDCKSVEQQVHQVRICIEVLRKYLLIAVPTAAQAAALSTAEAAYRLATYLALLGGSGATYQQVRLARHGTPAERQSTAQLLGIEVDPSRLPRPDRLDALLLDPQAVAPATSAITERGLERLFGLAATTVDRDPLSDGLVWTDAAGNIVRWRLNGADWGWNTDPDGLVYASVNHASGVYEVDLFRDAGRTTRVAFGSTSVATGPVTLFDDNDSGLSGTVYLAYKTDATDIVLSVLPALLAWRLDRLRPFWAEQDRPGDAYRDATSSAPLAAMPAGVTFPAALAGRITFDPGAATLMFDGVMSDDDRATLLGLSADAPYQFAVDALYVSSARPAVIDPDVIGPDDFRHPAAKAAAADPDGPFDLWLRRRAWVDDRLQAAGAVTKVVAGKSVPDLDGLLAAMYAPVTEGTTTVTPWSATTPVTALDDLGNRLAQGIDVMATAQRIAADLALPLDAFVRLMQLRAKDGAAQSDSRNPPVAIAEWSELFSILVQAAKRRLYCPWRDEEIAAGVQLGDRDFYQAAIEPVVADWPPAVPPGQPLIDPDLQKPRDLPEPVVGQRALAFRAARVADLIAGRANLESTRLLSGVDALLKQAWGSPNRGDAVPFNLSKLLADLNSNVPSTRSQATLDVTTGLKVSVDDFIRVMDVRARDAAADPADKPTASDWADVITILAGADKVLHLYPGWIAEEQAAATGVTYWMARKATLPAWRMGPGARVAWQQARGGRSARPVLDPDLVGPGELKVPFAGARAYDLWTTRRAWVDGRLAAIAAAIAAAATPLDGLDAAILSSTGATGADLVALDDARVTGDDIIARLDQLSLTLDAFDALLQVRRLVGGSVPVLSSEWSDVAAILTEVEKTRLFATWREEEAALPGGPRAGIGLVAGPDDFRLPVVSTDPFAPPPPSPPAWLATADARDGWLDVLRSRIDQQNAAVSALQQVIDAAEEATLPALRDALVLATDAPNSDPAAAAKWVTARIQVDAAMGGCHHVTRIELALETLQGLVQSVRNGQLPAWPPGQFWLDAPDFDEEWKWMGEYAPWRAAMLVWMYPHNLLAPSLRKWQTSAYAQLVDDLRWSTGLSPALACAEAAAYDDYFQDVCTIELQASVQTDTHVYKSSEGGCPVDVGERSLLYLFGTASRSNKAYCSVFDPSDGSGYAQSSWEAIPHLGPVATILGAAVYLHVIYVFAYHWELGARVLRYVRYDCETRQWLGDAIVLPLPKNPTTYYNFLVKQSEYERNPPHLMLDIDHEFYEKRLNYEGTGWADNNWIDFFLDRWSDVNVPGGSREYPRDAAVDLRGPVTLLAMVGIGGNPDIFDVFLSDHEGYLWVFYRKTTVSAEELLHGPAPSQYAWLRLNQAEYRGAFFWPNSFKVYLATSGPPLWWFEEQDDPSSPIGTWSSAAFSPFMPDLKMMVFNAGTSAGGTASRLHPYLLADGAYRGLLKRFGSALSASAPSRILPSVKTPFSLVPAASATDQQARAAFIQAAYAANAGAPASVHAYLEEAFRLVPLQIGLSLQAAGLYEAALGWMRSVYDYTVPAASRKIDYGLTLEESLPWLTGRLDDWLLDPLNPHLIAATRRNAYTRYAITSIVRCLYDYADAEFSRDTAESDAHARLLYSIALDLLDDPAFASGTDQCDGIWIKLGQDVILDWPWWGVWNRLKVTLADLGDRAVIKKAAEQVGQVMASGGSAPDRLRQASAIVARARIEAGGSQTMRTVLERRARVTGEAYRVLIADNHVAQAAATARANATREVTSNLSVALKVDVSRLERGRVDVPALRAPAVPLPVRSDSPAGSAPGRFARSLLVKEAVDKRFRRFIIIRAPTDWFCLPPDPTLDALLRHGELNLYKLRHCMNIAGMQRELDPYSAPTDLLSGLPSIGAGGQLIVPGAASQRGVVGLRPTPYRSTVLMDRAKQLVQMASQVEDHLLSALEKADAERYSQLKARQDVRIAQATVQMQDLRVQEAQAGVLLAQMQQDRARFQSDHWNQMLNAPISDLEQQSLDAMSQEANYQMASYAANAAAAAAAVVSISDLATSGSDALAKTGTALASLASVYGVTASKLAAQASYERRREDWQYQQGLAENDVRIGEQGVAIAEAHARVVGQERVIAQMQADNAAATVDFLTGKFTNLDLYDWMSGVLQRVYRFFLEQATAMALLSQNQLAFLRQEVPPAFIQTDYWSLPSSSTSSTAADRKGLTGSARLQQDIYQLDQYAFETDKRKLQLTKTISLLQLDPFAFQRFRETGVLPFVTSMDLFDRDFPGHYLRLVHRVRTTVVALVPPTQGIRAMLLNSGSSRVVIGGDLYQKVVARRDPELVALSAAANATGLFDLDVQPDMLLPFEGLGVEGHWELRMPRAANPFDFDAVADVLFTMEYTALHSFDYQQEVLQQLGRTLSGNRVFSFRQEFADAWYDLHNPDLTTTPMTVVLTTSGSDFPPNLDDVRIQHVSVYVARTDRSEFEWPIALQFSESASPATAGGTAQTLDGLVSTRNGNGAAWWSMIGKSPQGNWTLTLPNTMEVRRRFGIGGTEAVRDILLVVTFSGRTPAWPQ